ncbi:uncharacterized protein [Nicotiana sylvestris]|uniref:uncharacterized protein isoform X4 n=1 Tax=Nicotiana sylvestris TaxID=4096 RepID=UPI00388C48B4
MANSNKNGIASTNISALHCIDLSSPDIHTSVSLLKKACLDSGFFYVVNHKISQEFTDEVFAQSKKLFDLPLEEKMKLLRNEKHRGYTPVLDEHLDAVNQINGDYKEGYYIGVEALEDDPDAQRPFYGSNVWPTAGILPGWRETMEKYHQEALEVTKAVSRLIALALDLDADFFGQPEFLGKPIGTLRLLHYEGKLSDPSTGIFGAGAHTDYGLITLLATDDVCGLQICKDKDAKPQIWEYVPPLKGAFVVNLGDMLERWSNGIFRSTLHRVLGNGQERYSIAYFVEPSHDCLVECLATCQSKDNPPRNMSNENQTNGNVAGTGATVTSVAASSSRSTPAHAMAGKFSSIDFKRWQMKMLFYLTTLSLQRFIKEDPLVLAEGTPDDERFVVTEAWKHSDFLCKNYILSCLEDSLYNVYSVMETSKALWNALEKKYKTEDAGLKKFVAARFLDFKMIDTRSVITQVHELQVIVHDLLAEAFQVAAFIEKLPPCWKDFKNYLKHKRKEMTLEDLIVRLRIEEDNKNAEKKSRGNSTIIRANIVEEAPQNKKRKKASGPKNYPSKKKFKGNCHNCGKSGHKAVDCRAPKNDKKKKKNQANMVENAEEMEDLCAMLSECNLDPMRKFLWEIRLQPKLKELARLR